MYYQVSRKKSVIFKILYLVFSALAIAYTAYIFIENIVNGINNGLSFDDIVLLIATLISMLFEGAIIWFIIRSFKEPTVLMKNLVFKNDGTPYKPGIIITCVGIAITLAMVVVMFVSAYVVELIKIPVRAQYFILDVGLTLFVNLAFVLAYFFTYRHESGSFAII